MSKISHIADRRIKSNPDIQMTMRIRGALMADERIRWHIETVFPEGGEWLEDSTIAEVLRRVAKVFDGDCDNRHRVEETDP